MKNELMTKFFTSLAQQLENDSQDARFERRFSTDAAEEDKKAWADVVNRYLRQS